MPVGREVYAATLDGGLKNPKILSAEVTTGRLDVASAEVIRQVAAL